MARRIHKQPPEGRQRNPQDYWYVTNALLMVLTRLLLHSRPVIMRGFRWIEIVLKPLLPNPMTDRNSKVPLYVLSVIPADTIFLAIPILLLEICVQYVLPV